MSATQEKLKKLLYKALRPLVHLLIESGIGHREFSEVAKKAYVDVASKNYGIRGRDTNISRVAVMTGLTRKEVKRIRDESDGVERPTPTRQIPAGRILQYWHSDSDFLEPDGQPLDLNFSDEKPSFFELARKYAGDIPAGALRTELKRAGAVESTQDGKLRVMRREFRVIEPEQQLAWSLGRAIFGSISNTAHNFLERRSKKQESKVDIWPSRIVEAVKVREADLPAVKQIVSDQATAFCEQLDDAIAPFSEHADCRDPRIVRISLVYFLDE